jgi:CRISPR/Cas system endoribonuclease Cas6 (RAMP superfamily)
VSMSYFDQKKFKKQIKKNLLKRGKGDYRTNALGGFYFIGFIGAAVYFVSTAEDFWPGVLGVIKATVWPAVLVYEALNHLGA